jgi:single-strand DNA-binding protein
MDLNRVLLIGRLTKDPDLRFTPDGIPVATLRIAVNRRKSREGGEEADFFNVVAWRKLAELCAEYVGKGRLIAVDGRLRRRSWRTSEGQPRSDVEIVADSIQFLDRPARSTDESFFEEFKDTEEISSTEEESEAFEEDK